MLDPKYIRADATEVFAQLARRGAEFSLADYRQLENQRKVLQTEAEDLRAQSKARSQEIGRLKAAGKDAKAPLAEVERIKRRLRDKEERFAAVKARLDEFLLTLPNMPDVSAPDGKDENDNREVGRHGAPPQFDFEPQDHIALGEKLGLFDMPAAGKVAGSRFAVAYDGFARLHRALGQFMLDVHTSRHGYREAYLPYIVNAGALLGSGQLPKFEEDLFRLADTQFYLIPTAEVPLVNLYRDAIIDAASLPVKLAAHTPCFRSEAGAYGKDTHGLIRQHQFDKVELVQLTAADDSCRALEEITSHAQVILQELNLAYRTVELCAGDLGFAAAKTYDLEVWLPGQGCYREISSCSNTLDFQARRLQIRTRAKAGEKPRLVHTLNGSGLAVGRALIAVLENYQTASGAITVPEVLRPYMNGCDVIGEA